MKPICLNCGEEIIATFNLSKRRFCSQECSNHFYSQKKHQGGLDVSLHFDLLKNIANAAESYDEFKQLTNQYFGDVFKEASDID